MIINKEYSIRLDSGIERFTPYKSNELDGLAKKVLSSVANVFIYLGNLFYRVFFSPDKKEILNKETISNEPKQLLKMSMNDLITNGDKLCLTSMLYNQALSTLNPELPNNGEQKNPFNQDELQILKNCFFDRALDAYKKEFQDIHQTEISEQDMEDFRINNTEMIHQIAEGRLKSATPDEIKEYKEIIKILIK